MATRRPKPLFRYRITRLGFHVLFVALFAMIGGALRGFNLLLVLAGLLISVVLLQWRSGRHAILRADLRRHGGSGVFAGTPATMRYDVRNSGRWSPLWCLRIEDPLIAADAGDTRAATGPLDEKHPGAVIATLVASLGHVPPGQTRSTSVICRFHRRGRYRLGPVVVSTTFPFGLMNCERLGPETSESLWVYPRLLTLRRGWTAMLPPRRGGDGHRSSGGSNDDGEFFGLRPWQSGDHVKHIHWRTTARIGAPAVRQFEQRNRHQLCFIVDVVDNESTRGGEERVLEAAATMISELACTTSSMALLVADAHALGSSSHCGVYTSARADVTPLLERLAIAKPVRLDDSRNDPLARAVAQQASQLFPYDLVVVSQRRFSDVTQRRSADPAREKALSVWRYFDQRSRLAWINVDSPAVARYLSIDDGGHLKSGVTREAANVDG
ncbi:hypothetical protein Mal15_50930 [Stieleria maiorica]|uniref:DUF58 domain-containing protein n=1 Tax=Stieleria maiorica TaxID=2795974 RepID=A0A5B9MM12_9BACT|nr:DUF58 domain-containing protein [Stieleria maiorica]QEG01017.1 hypothetical protein Mal15_50930 [Stieleria maiorica]